MPFSELHALQVHGMVIYSMATYETPMLEVAFMMDCIFRANPKGKKVSYL